MQRVYTGYRVYWSYQQGWAGYGPEMLNESLINHAFYPVCCGPHPARQDFAYRLSVVYYQWHCRQFGHRVGLYNKRSQNIIAIPITPLKVFFCKSWFEKKNQQTTKQHIRNLISMQNLILKCQNYIIWNYCLKYWVSIE